MLNSLKHRIIDWLGLATQDEVHHAIHFVLGKIPEAVAAELDKDERTLVVNPVISLHVDEQGIKDAVNEKIDEFLSGRNQ